MKINTHNVVVILVAALASTAAFAQVATIATQDEGPPLERSAVIASLNEARQSGELAAISSEDSGEFYRMQHRGEPMFSRSEARREVALAMARGEIRSMIGEDSGSFQNSQPTTSRQATDTVPLEAIVATTDR